VAASTLVAPALGILIDNLNQQVLHLAWTTPAGAIDFARYEPALSAWTLTDSPFVLPAGPLTGLTPSFGSTITRSSDGRCHSSNDLYYTGDEPPPAVHWHTHSQHGQGCP